MILEHPRTPNMPEVETPADQLEHLPWQLEALIRAAIDGRLPTSTPITQGLIPDLNVFVISWACSYLLRSPDALKRLWEARRAWDWHLKRVQP